MHPPIHLNWVAVVVAVIASFFLRLVLVRACRIASTPRASNSPGLILKPPNSPR